MTFRFSKNFIPVTLKQSKINNLNTFVKNMKAGDVLLLDGYLYFPYEEFLLNYLTDSNLKSVNIINGLDVLNYDILNIDKEKIKNENLLEIKYMQNFINDQRQFIENRDLSKKYIIYHSNLNFNILLTIHKYIDQRKINNFYESLNLISNKNLYDYNVAYQSLIFKLKKELKKIKSISRKFITEPYLYLNDIFTNFNESFSERLEKYLNLILSNSKDETISLSYIENDFFLSSAILNNPNYHIGLTETKHRVIVL